MDAGKQNHQKMSKNPQNHCHFEVWSIYLWIIFLFYQFVELHIRFISTVLNIQYLRQKMLIIKAGNHSKINIVEKLYSKF